MSLGNPPWAGKYVLSGGTHDNLAIVANGVSDSSPPGCTWSDLVSTVLADVTPDDVHCVLGVDAVSGAVFLDNCRRSKSFEYMVFKDIPLLSSIANWVRQMDLERVRTLKDALISLEGNMNTLKTGISAILFTTYSAEQKHDELLNLIARARDVHIPSGPAKMCMPSYTPTNNLNKDDTIYLCKLTLVAELSHAYNTKRSARVMHTASSELLHKHLWPYLNTLNALNVEGISTAEMSNKLTGVEESLKRFNMDSVIRDINRQI